MMPYLFLTTSTESGMSVFDDYDDDQDLDIFPVKKIQNFDNSFLQRTKQYSISTSTKS